MGIPLPNTGSKNGATQAQASRLYDHDPSFVDLLPWAEYLPDEQVMLLEDGRSRAVFFELVPLGTEGRDPNSLQTLRICAPVLIEELQQIQLRAVDRRDIVSQIKQLLDEWLQQHPQPDTAQQALIEAVDRAEILQRRQA